MKITFKIGLEFKKIVLILPLIRSFMSRATARTRRALRNPIPRRKWKPIKDRKFGYDVSVLRPSLETGQR